VLTFVAATRPAGQAAGPAPVANAQSTQTQSSAEEAATGNRIVESPCLDVGAAHCLASDPTLKAPIELLRGTHEGPDLLKTTASAGVTIRAGTAPPGALAAFRHRSRAVTLDTRLLNYSARAQAAVLAHELRHVSDWSKLGPSFADNPLTCYGTEANAFHTEAAVWTELRGASGPADRLEQEVDTIAQGVQHGGAGFWLSLGGDYLDECA
jgi:hypothetical protein